RGDAVALPREYFRVVRAGWLHMGVGSAEELKVLLRIEGPSADPADDELIEAKRLGSLDGLTCLEEPPSPQTARVIIGSHQMGRLKHRIPSPGPDLVIPQLLLVRTSLRDWWTRRREPSYPQ